jgi:hypothetical protein
MEQFYYSAIDKQLPDHIIALAPVMIYKGSAYGNIDNNRVYLCYKFIHKCEITENDFIKLVNDYFKNSTIIRENNGYRICIPDIVEEFNKSSSLFTGFKAKFNSEIRAKKDRLNAFLNDFNRGLYNNLNDKEIIIDTEQNNDDKGIIIDTEQNNDDKEIIIDTEQNNDKGIIIDTEQNNDEKITVNNNDKIETSNDIIVENNNSMDLDNPPRKISDDTEDLIINDSIEQISDDIKDLTIDDIEENGLENSDLVSQWKNIFYAFINGPKKIDENSNINIEYKLLFEILDNMKKNARTDIMKKKLASMKGGITRSYKTYKKDDSDKARYIKRINKFYENIPRPSSHKIGQIGEHFVEAIIIENNWSYRNVGSKANTCDFIIEGKIAIEVKNYQTTVPTTEVDKFVRDMIKYIDCNIGLMISLRSKITKKERDDTNGKTLILLETHNENEIIKMINHLLKN